MPKEQSPGKPTTRRYSAEDKAAAVRMVRPRIGQRRQKSETKKWFRISLAQFRFG
jgi:hypothetical protein